MKEYTKIQSIFKRDMGNGGKFTNEYALPEFEYLKDNLWEFTEKIDGTNIRVMYNGNEIKFGGKTDNAQIPVFLYDKLNFLFKDKLDLFTSIFQSETEVCLYGEGYGAKIQKGGGNYIKDGVDFILFDVKIGDWWLKQIDVNDIAEKLGLKVVPFLEYGTLNQAIEMCKKGFNSSFGNFIAEGLVLRNPLGLMLRNGRRIITKIKYKDFKESNQ